MKYIYNRKLEYIGVDIKYKLQYFLKCYETNKKCADISLSSPNYAYQLIVDGLSLSTVVHVHHYISIKISVSDI